jgi:acetyl-CoA acyltransferase
MDAYILDAVRTPFGRHRGGLSSVRTDDLAALPLRELVSRNAALDPAALDDVIYGNTNGAGEENRNVARMATLLADLPVTVPGSTVNRLCASGGEAVVQAARSLAVGDARFVVAGGVEGMSRAPYVVPKPDEGLPKQMEMHQTRWGGAWSTPRSPSTGPTRWERAPSGSRPSSESAAPSRTSGRCGATAGRRGVGQAAARRLRHGGRRA